LLENPESFRAALKLTKDNLVLAVLAFVSYLWNEAVVDKLIKEVGEEEIYWVRYLAGKLAFPKKGSRKGMEFAEANLSETLELPHHKNTGEVARTYEALLKRFDDSFGIRTLKRLNKLVPLPRRSRELILPLKQIRLEKLDGSLATEFVLPPGCYATIALKNLLA
jgi:tRNA(Glu) U13 pseudouridine synthase TruD